MSYREKYNDHRLSVIVGSIALVINIAAHLCAVRTWMANIHLIFVIGIAALLVVKINEMQKAKRWIVFDDFLKPE